MALVAGALRRKGKPVRAPQAGVKFCPRPTSNLPHSRLGENSSLQVCWLTDWDEAFPLPGLSWSPIALAKKSS